MAVRSITAKTPEGYVQVGKAYLDEQRGSITLRFFSEPNETEFGREEPVEKYLNASRTKDGGVWINIYPNKGKRFVLEDVPVANEHAFPAAE